MKTKRASDPPPILREDDPAYDLERYTPLQAADYLCMSVRLIYQEAAAERLAHRRNGRRGQLMFSQRDLDTWRLARRRAANDRASRDVIAAARSIPVSDITPLRAAMPRHRRFLQ